MKTNTYLALLLAAVVTWGCGSSDTSTIPATTPSAQKSGTVTFSVKFPAAAATKAFIDSRMDKVIINGYSNMGDWEMDPPVELTPANPTVTVEVPEGQLCFDADAQDSAGATFDYASTCGEVVAGINNKAILTFLGADWEFVNAAGTPTALTLSSASHGNVNLAGFRLDPIHYAGPGKAAIDKSKPRGGAESYLQFFSGTTTAALRFGPTVKALSASQFLAGASASTNYTSFVSRDLNLDVPANPPDNNYWYPGERIAYILDVVGDDPSETITGSNGQNAIPTLQPYANSQIVDGSTITGHFLEFTMGQTIPTRIEKTPNVDCSAYWQQNQGMPARAAAISKALATKSGSASKAAPGDATTLDSGIVTVVFDDCETNASAVRVDGDGDGDMFDGDWLNDDVNNNGRYDAADGDTYVDVNSDGNFDFTYYPGTIYTYTMTFSNVIAREFRAKAQPKGTSFIPPPATITASNAYIEYRTHENAANNRYVAWIDYKDNGVPVNQADLAGVQLLDPGNNVLPGTPTFQQANYLTATWNPATSSFGTASAAGYSGYFFELGTSDLPLGDYTFKTELAAGQLLQTTRNFASKVEAPVVLSSSMIATTNTSNNSLTLSWAAPPTGTFSSYRVVVRKMLATSTPEIFYAVVPVGTTSMTLSETLLMQIALASGVTTTTKLGWEVQTRRYDANNVEVARGRSTMISTEPATANVGIN